MNYRESLLTYEAADGETLVVSAFKVKALRGARAATEVTAEPVEGRVVTITVPRPVADVREELMRALAAGE
jgi:hypothetical protein